MEEIKIQVKSLCCGNEEINIFFGEHRISFYASYLGQEPMASLVQAVYELEECGVCDMDNDEVRYESEVRWLDEPGFLTMEFRRTDETLYIHMKTADDFECKSIMEEELCFHVSFKTFKEAVIRESLRMLREYGIKGYYDSWADGKDFPLALLLSLLGKGCVESEDWTCKSSLQDELKTIMDLTNNII